MSVRNADGRAPGIDRATLATFGLLATVTLILSLSALSLDVYGALRYERTGTLQGQWWRLITCHFIHVNAQHLLLNVVGTVLIAALFPRLYSTTLWLAIFGASALAIDAGLLALERELEWYVGLSGLLHGALAAGVVALWRTERGWLAAALTAGLTVKLGWEQWQEALPLMGSVPVIVDAHLYGAVGGALAGLLLGAQRGRTESAASL